MHHSRLFKQQGIDLQHNRRRTKHKNHVRSSPSLYSRPRTMESKLNPRDCNGLRHLPRGLCGRHSWYNQCWKQGRNRTQTETSHNQSINMARHTRPELSNTKIRDSPFDKTTHTDWDHPKYWRSYTLHTRQNVNHLGMRLDSKITFSKQIKHATTKAGKTKKQLSCLMANIGGPTYSCTGAGHGRKQSSGKKVKISTGSPTNIGFENYVRIPHSIGSRCPRHSRSGAYRSHHKRKA